MNSKIKNRRKELGLTLKDIAENVGVSVATVSRWESGDILNMKKDKIFSLASVLKVPSSFIISEEDEEIDDTGDNGFVSYSSKTFDEFLNNLNYEDEISFSLALNKNGDNSVQDIEIVKIPKSTHKEFLKILKNLKP